ncbi:hypothetical protein [Rhizobium mulingense]|uniref:Uncharacterized protein n=1 Tax=Rhizobium mulingense TaxID=3031128 RepID=A0ACC6N5T7_9HYPH|nr:MULTISPECIES: hypothetical protein [unclassified Rhizobium]MEA3520835.1 hypothetical protein [Rhizobium sp. MJ31]MEB3047731.1 hypothetical protein [Rhizobium sp. MJ21]
MTGLSGHATCIVVMPLDIQILRALGKVVVQQANGIRRAGAAAVTFPQELQGG